MNGSRTERVKILGVGVDPLTVDQLHDRLAAYIDRGDHALVLNVNVNCLNLAQSRPWLRDLLNAAELVFCDGAGVILGARLLGHRIPERITFADWMHQLAGFGVPRGYSFFYLGAEPGVAEEAARRMTGLFPGLKIVGTADGFFDKMAGSESNERVLMEINARSPDILVVGFGMPLQERWLAENWSRIDARVALAGGAVFDYLSGRLRRAPPWMTNHGMEWLGRLLIEPRRLWHRYLVGNPLFLARVLRQRLQSVGEAK